MLKRFWLLLASFTLLLPLSGCWDSKYLDDLSIVLAIGIDKDPKNEKNIKVTLQVVVPNQVADSQSGGSKEGIPVTNYTGTGETLVKTFQSMTHLTPRRLYFSHNQVMIIGEEMARKGVENLFDIVDRDPEIRTDFGVLIAKNGTAEDTLKTITTMEKIPVQQIYGMIKTLHQRVGSIYPVTIRELIQSIESDKEDPAIPSIEMIGNANEAQKKSNTEQIEPENYLRMDSMAIFRDGKLIGFLSENDSKGLTIVKNKLKRMIIEIPVGENEKVTISPIHNQTKVEAVFRNNKPMIVIKVEHKASVLDNKSTAIKLQDNNQIRWLEKEAERIQRNLIMRSMMQLQRMNCDSAGYAKFINQTSPKYWNKNKKDWEAIYPGIPLRVDVNVTIVGTGIRTRTYLGDK
ncbi:Ger(x)C family spore germination protein [Paenibacillus sp. HJL G12]|uniref:Ger(X)C family spore germination protein n=1 Tax=Paenibacillus dendrobii TaxID=2691084 RepID=A0A7X3IIM1_9BACL|nr:Ger(x)C family spore germination protein [Paenibacillus dendrobii]MWV43245.1 Ger(x)C family spore germination protein [Paenibacillus dendrobii]